MQNDDTFKSTYKVLDELSEKWSNLTDIQQAAITELVAGKRQGNIMSAVMENFDIARDAVNTSINSAGSAMEEYNIWLNSVEAKQQKFTAQFQALSDTVIGSELIKGVYDSGTGILGFLTTLIDKLGALPTIAATAAAALSFKNVGKIKNMPVYAPLQFAA